MYLLWQLIKNLEWLCLEINQWLVLLFVFSGQFLVVQSIYSINFAEDSV